MTSTVTFRMVDGSVYEVQQSTLQANALVETLARNWLGRPLKVDTLHLADGASVTINPAHVVSIEVR